MATKKSQTKSSIENRRARFDFALGEEFVVGLSLTGPEVRAIRDGRAQLKGAFVTIRNNELWLNNATLSIRKSEPGTSQIAVDTSPRKLLAHRKEIDKLAAAKAAGMTIVPLRLLTKGQYIKAVIALAKGKKNYDKRESIKRRQADRDARRQIKNI